MVRSYQICTRCVMDTSDPDITFDQDGYCNHCTKYFQRASKNKSREENAEKEFQRVIDKIKKSGKNNKYDCAIGVSGGVDSSYVVYLAKKYGLRPLAVHIDNGWDSEIAVQNIRNMCKRFDIDYESYVLDWQEFKDIQLSFLRSGIIEVEIPNDAAITGALHKVAGANRIKYMLSGSNYTTEGILPTGWFYDPLDKTLLKAIQRKFGKLKMKAYPVFGYREQLYFKFIAGIKMVYLLNYLPYEPGKAKNRLIEEFGWKSPGGKHYENIFTRFVQSYIQPVKFNVDYRRAILSNQVCAGIISREEALKILNQKSYNADTLQRDKEYVSKKLGITINDFEDIMAAPPKSYKDYPNNEKLVRFIHRWYKRLFPHGRV
jgi:N-acetyl sugar amidotransferase